MNKFLIVNFQKLIIIGLYLCIVIVASNGCFRRTDPSFQQGQEIYKADCLPCHGPNGAGVLYSKSALNNNTLVTGDPNELIAVILFGREGAGAMPGWKMTLTDQEVAAVATYIRQAWSNRADPITPAMVKEIRTKGERTSFTNPMQ